MSIKSKIKKTGRFILLNMGHPIHLEQRLRSGSELLKGRCIVVTGGTSGIGYASAEACLRAGAKVIVTSRSLTRAEEAASRLGAGASGAALDLANAEGMAAQVDAIYASSRGGWMHS